MFTAFIIVTVFTAAANTYAAIVDFRRPQWVLNNMSKWGGSHSWLFTLDALKAAGVLGLLAGIGVPLIGVAAAVGLVSFFVGAIAVRRACWLVFAPSLAGDVSISGDWIAGIATGHVVKQVTPASQPHKLSGPPPRLCQGNGGQASRRSLWVHSKNLR
jgi:DoxX-like family